MSYCTAANVESALGLEADTLTTGQDTMLALLITQVTNLMKLYTKSKLAGTETGLADTCALAVAHLYKHPEDYYVREWRDCLKEDCRALLTTKDYKRLALVADSSTPFRQDED